MPRRPGQRDQFWWSDWTYQMLSRNILTVPELVERLAYERLIERSVFGRFR